MENSVRLSPSAISAFSGCERKFYCRHIERLPEKPSVHQIRGRIIHKVLEVFFDTIDISTAGREKPFSENQIFAFGKNGRILPLAKSRALGKNSLRLKHWHKVWEDFRKIIFELLDSEWKKIGVKGSGYEDLFESKEQKEFFLQESKEFLDFFTVKMAYSLCNKSAELADDEWRDLNLKKHFYPKHKEFKIELVEENIVGFIDKTLNLFGDGVAIVDYKTSKSTLPHFISESDLKQCKAYAWLWHKKFNELPRFISIFYVRDGESIYYPISERDLQEIESDIKLIRSKGREKSNFQKKPSRLCNYCDFFSNCFESREEFEKKLAGKDSRNLSEF